MDARVKAPALPLVDVPLRLCIRLAVSVDTVAAAVTPMSVSLICRDAVPVLPVAANPTIDVLLTCLLRAPTPLLAATPAIAMLLSVLTVREPIATVDGTPTSDSAAVAPSAPMLAVAVAPLIAVGTNSYCRA